MSRSNIYVHRFLVGDLAGKGVIVKKSVLTMVCCLVCFAGAASAEPISMGEAFPEVRLPVPVQKGALSYLGLDARDSFTIQQVKARVVLIEMLNVLCPHCRKQTKPYNRLFQMLKDDPETREQVKMLGVAVGNSDEQIADFVEVYAVAFPVVADRQFTLHRALRAGPTPFSIYLLQDSSGGPGVVAGTQLGEDRQMEDLFAYLNDLLDMQTADFAGLAESQPTAAVTAPALPMLREELEARIRDRIRKTYGGVTSLSRQELSGNDFIYLVGINSQGKPQTLYARVVSRSAICDVCHDVHFYYLFDRQGTILDLVPLHLTKYGNIEWTDTETKQFKSRLVGKQLDSDWDFRPEVDAVTSATMTSAIIYNSLAMDRKLLKQLKSMAE